MIFKNVKPYAFLAAMLLSGGIAFASSSHGDVLMTIDGHPVSLAEFEYFYAKDNPGGNGPRMAVEDYLPLFVDYRLKVQAARDAGLAVASVGTEGDAVVPVDEKRAYDRYLSMQHQVAGKGGAVKTAHILVRMDQMATVAMQERAHEKADSISRALQGGADFAQLARRCSDDTASAKQGGVLPWIERGQTVKVFEDAAFALRVGEVSQPVLSEFGYHIIRLDDKRDAVPYEALRTEILRTIDAADIRERIAENPAGTVTARVRSSRAEEPQWEGEESEFRDALLLNAVCEREVWRKAAADKEGLQNFFVQNRKKMRYKGKEPDDTVLADYQDYLERQWVASLRTKYRVQVNPDVLATVNKH